MKLHNILRMLPLLALMQLGAASCDYIHEDIEPCDHYLHFSYTYNMLSADAFVPQMTNQETAKQVELFIYDEAGQFLRSQTISSAELETNRIQLDLEPGTYQLLAWAGLNDTDYTWTKPEAGDNIDDWQVRVNGVTDCVERELLGLFQGRMTLTIPEGGETDTEFPLVKNTNKIRFVLIDANSGTEVSTNDYTVMAVTTNGDLDANNQPISDDTFVWTPYTKSVEQVNDPEGNAVYQAVCMELNTLRLIDGSANQLQIRHDGEELPFLHVSLTDLLLLTQMESHDMTAQEYLDRQDEYVIMLYLDTTGGTAHCLEIIVNDWTIRLDDVNLGR